MKKILVILLTIALVFSFTACGGGSSEEDVSSTEKATPTITEMSEDMIKKVASNKAAASDLIDEDNTTLSLYSFYARVLRIEEEYAVVSFINDWGEDIVDPSSMVAWLILDKSTLVELEQGMEMDVTTKITDIGDTVTENGVGGTYHGISLVCYEPDICYEYEFTGELMGVNEYYNQDHIWDLNNGGGQAMIEFDKSVNVKEYYDYIGKEVTIYGIIYSDMIRKAEIIEVHDK